MAAEQEQGKSIKQQMIERENEKLANAQARINKLPVGVKRALAHEIYQEEMENKGRIMIVVTQSC